MEDNDNVVSSTTVIKALASRKGELLMKLAHSLRKQTNLRLKVGNTFVPITKNIIGDRLQVFLETQELAIPNPEDKSLSYLTPDRILKLFVEILHLLWQAGSETVTTDSIRAQTHEKSYSTTAVRFLSSIGLVTQGGKGRLLTEKGKALVQGNVPGVETWNELALQYENVAHVVCSIQQLEEAHQELLDSQVDWQPPSPEENTWEIVRERLKDYLDGEYIARFVSHDLRNQEERLDDLAKILHQLWLANGEAVHSKRLGVLAECSVYGRTKWLKSHKLISLKGYKQNVLTEKGKKLVEGRP